MVAKQLAEKMGEVYAQRLVKILMAAIRLAEMPDAAYGRVPEAALKDLVVLQAGTIKRATQRNKVIILTTHSCE